MSDIRTPSVACAARTSLLYPAIFVRKAHATAATQNLSISNHLVECANPASALRVGNHAADPERTKHGFAHQKQERSDLIGEILPVPPFPTAQVFTHR
jgi:hypothetical protein